jgi:hypothetical protein
MWHNKKDLFFYYTPMASNNLELKNQNTELTYYVRLAVKTNFNIEMFLGFIYFTVSISDYVTSNDGMMN